MIFKLYFGKQFFFDNKQIIGIALGTKFTTVYTTLTVGYLEKNIIQRNLETCFAASFGNDFITN